MEIPNAFAKSLWSIREKRRSVAFLNFMYAVLLTTSSSSIILHTDSTKTGKIRSQPSTCTICASLRRNAASNSCRSTEIAGYRDAGRDAPDSTPSSPMRGRRSFPWCLSRHSTGSREASNTSCKSWTSSTALALCSSPVRENVDTSGAMGRLFLTLIGSIAELESDLIRERVLAGMRRAKLDGVRIGRCASSQSKSKQDLSLLT